MRKQLIMLLFLLLWSFAAVAVEIPPTEGIADEADQHRADPHAGHVPECRGYQFVQMPFLQADLQRTLTADDTSLDTVDVSTPRARFPSTAVDAQVQVVPMMLTRQGTVAAERIKDEPEGSLTDAIVPGSAFVHKPTEQSVAFAGIRGEALAARRGFQSEANAGRGEEGARDRETPVIFESPDAILNVSLLSRLDVLLQTMVDRASEVTPEVRANVSNVVLFTMVGIFVFMVVGAVVFVI